ncbi:MAG TPA: TonB family protein [Terriglobales bacterium]|nr:TonB family protein [Terriglobales bacterium]
MPPVANPEALDLLDQIKSHKLDLDSALALIVDRAAEITSASGAALALGPRQACYCRASFGDAPEVGVPIRPDSGLTGECVRECHTVRCEDAHNDPRLDPAVCRQLNLRSAVLVPLFSGPDGRDFSGVLEVSSSRAHAFSSGQISKLEELAEIASLLAFGGTAASQQHNAPARISMLETTEPAESFPGPRGLRLQLDTLLHRLRDLRGIRWIVAAALLVVIGGALLFSGRAAQRPPAMESRQSASIQPTPVAATLSPAPATSDVLVDAAKGSPNSRTAASQAKPSAPKPSALISRTPASRSHESDSSAASTVQDTTTVLASSGAGRSQSTQAPSSATADKSHTAPEPPLIAGNLGHSTNVVFLALPTVPGKPSSPVRHSEGVTGGTLIYRVMPSYPAMARGGKLEGEIVLSAVVAPDGTVKSVRAVNGNPILANAAIDAVKQWRYDPFKLNGVPIETETTVKVKFSRSN